MDRPGLLLKSQGEDLTIGQGPFARDDRDWQGKEHDDLLSVIKEVKPHVLIGTSTKPKAFTEEVVKEMSKHVERPIIFPLSNPTRLHEADPKDINEWSEGKALIATGSPFPPVEYNGKKYEVGKWATQFLQAEPELIHLRSRMQQLDCLPRHRSRRRPLSLPSPLG